MQFVSGMLSSSHQYSHGSSGANGGGNGGEGGDGGTAGGMSDDRNGTGSGGETGSGGVDSTGSESCATLSMHIARNHPAASCLGMIPTTHETPLRRTRRTPFLPFLTRGRSFLLP